ncbi:hypothetical protein [Streptomyces sp. NBC_01264]|uniref:hypothetical protein n=1 Tax=Streptomyces sp. NBC_01264 TaxID=2903804 RepID=UPI002257B5B3|nr:hypothetical protein [Streptomyces sp. NBC_01264]MCX4781049.1 hypothetical protein [Streptomyces sp. NBC_01264]
MNTISRSRRPLVRAAAVAVGAGTLLAFPTAAALADGVPSASSAQGGSAPRTLVKTLSLADGVSTAHVYRVAKDAYQADVLNPDGTTAATLISRDGSTGFGDAGEMHLALRSDGRLTSWAGPGNDSGNGNGSGSGSPAENAGYKTANRDGRVVPAAAPRGGTGTVEALGLSTLADGPGDGVLLLAAGGGIAAVGAAGLGFAMLRRGRTDA